jgi:hypothetical protein
MTMEKTIQQASAIDAAQTTSTVTLLAPHGLGYGQGGISYAARAGAAVNIAELEAAVQSKQILIPVDRDENGKPLDDDGCGDGRKAVRVQEGKIIHKRSLNRAKVFGGGAAMVASGLIGLGKAGDMSVNELFRTALRQLHDLHIGYGAHTDQHHTDPKACGCGAIDKAPLIILNVVAYEKEIRGSLSALGIDNSPVIDELFDAYKAYAAFAALDADYEGRKVADDIINSGVVVKDLGDEHKEMYVVLNHIEGLTINQEYIRAISDGQAQVFGVDVWRMQDIARRAFATDSDKAFLSELLYTLGVAATLTKGDLPVYIVQPL